MILKVPPELEAKLARLAAQTGRTVEQVALDLLASSVIMKNGSDAKSRRVERPLVKVDCSTTMRSSIESTSAIAADARSMERHATTISGTLRATPGRPSR